MCEILDKKILHENLKQIVVRSPLIAKHASPGQFVIVMTDEMGERIPITIADYDKERGTVTLIFLEIGTSTKKLGSLEIGDRLFSICGPLGNPSEINKFGTVACVGGGVGIASLYPIVKSLKEKENKVISILGARTRNLLIMEKEISEYSDDLLVSTDDGSKGKKGFVTDILKEIFDDGIRIDRVVAVGPVVMMKAVSELTKKYNVKTIVSLNPIMVCGMGMCGACRVRVGGKIRFACVDGPEFDGHEVDFDHLMKRNQRFVEEEGISFRKYLDSQWKMRV